MLCCPGNGQELLSVYSDFLIAFLSFILPVEDCSLGSRKLVVFNHFSQTSFLNFQLCFILAAALQYF